MYGELGATETTQYHQHSSTKENMSSYIAILFGSLQIQNILYSEKMCISVTNKQKSNVVQL